MRNISLNPLIFGSFWNNNKFRERRIQIALTLPDLESKSSHNTDVTDVIPAKHSRILLHKQLTPTLAGSASRTLSPSTHTTDVTNGGLPSRHSQGLLHEDQHTEIRHAGMCDTFAIQHLPVEVLGEIFRHCVEADHRRIGYASPDRWSAPLLLCRVCAYWRQVAISTPVLWSKFSAQYTGSLPSQLIQLWLDRSQAHPLSFHLAQWRPSQAGLLAHAHNIMNLFFPHFSRCYDLSIVLDNTLVRQLLSIPIKDKNSVESFTLDTNICTKEFIDKIPNLIHSFTNIRRLSIRACETDNMSQSPLLTIPWSQLTHVELNFPLPVKTFAVILVQCVEIVELSVDSLRSDLDSLWRDLVLNASTPILLPHLRLLHIRCRCLNDGSGAQCYVEELLQVLTLPALRQFRFYHPSRRATWGRVYFPEFLVRSGCPLESLILFDYALVEDDIIALLSLPHLQSLRKIELLSHHISDRTLDLLTYPSSGTGVLPNLESIGVFDCSTSDGKLADMVASRWSPNPTTRQISHLATLKYRFYEPGSSAVPIPCHDQDYSLIRKFKADGLKVPFM